MNGPMVEKDAPQVLIKTPGQDPEFKPIDQKTEEQIAQALDDEGYVPDIRDATTDINP